LITAEYGSQEYNRQRNLPDPPTKRFRYFAVGEGCRFEMTTYPGGTLIGEGTVDLAHDPTTRFEFEPAKGLKPPLPVCTEAGHIYARLQFGHLRAEPLR
jgi:hypothetical protein